MRNEIEKICLVLSACLFGLGACGGEDGGSNENSPVNNIVPIVNAGADQSVNEESLVTLSATASDSDGTIVSYQWQQTTGSDVTLSNVNSAMASFTAPTLTTSETLTFSLTAVDNEGASGSDNINITINSDNAIPSTFTHVIYIDNQLPVESCDTYNIATRNCVEGDELAYRSLSAGASMAQASTAVYIRQGTFTETLIVQISGTVDDPRII